jgi:hypothetical protein
MKLISMTDFVLNETKSTTTLTLSESFQKCVTYANFLKQPLKLEMFVPCDENGNFLEEPEDFKYFIQDDEFGAYNGKEELQCIACLKAKAKVLFEGFWLDETYKMNNKQLPYLTNGEISVFLHSDFAIRNEFIEEISGANIELTPNAIQRIFG